MAANAAVPDWLVFLAGVLTPKTHRDFIRADLADTCKSASEYVQRAARYVTGVFKQRIRESFHILLWVGEMLALALPVLQKPVLPTVTLVAAVTAFLRVYDIYTEDTEGTPLGMAIDGLVIATFTGILEFGLEWKAPAFALIPLQVFQAAVLGGILAAGWRTAFRQRDPLDPRIKKLKESYIATWHMNVLFIGAIFPLGLTNTAAVPDHGIQRDPVLGALPFVMMALSYRIQTGRGLLRGPRIEHYEYQDFQRGVLKDWLSRVWAPEQPKRYRLPGYLLAEILYFAVLLVCPAIACWRAVFGTATEPTEWRQIEINVTATAALAVLWFRIKQMNRKLQQALAEEIKRRGKTLGG